jgi:hypothetical protein
MFRLFTILFWFAIFIGAVGVFLNTDFGDEVLWQMAQYVRIEQDVQSTAVNQENLRMIQDRINQLNEFSATRSKLLHDRLTLLRESDENRQLFSDKALAYLKDYPSNAPAGKNTLEGLKDAIITLRGPSAGITQADEVMQKVRDLEKALTGMSATPSQYAYEHHAAAVANMERLASQYKTMTNDLIYQKAMLNNVTYKARDSSEKMRNLQNLINAHEQWTYSMSQRLASQTEIMQNRLAAQMDRLAAMQERSSMQMERSYAQLERMYQRMESMRERMEMQNSRLQSLLERSAAQSERLQSMQERASSMQQRMSNVGSR